MRGLAMLGVLACSAGLAQAEVQTNTAYVEDLATDGTTLWVATRGGVEGYALQTQQRTKLYTSAAGLPESWARSVKLVDGKLEVATSRARCTLVGERFACTPRFDFVAPAPHAAPSAHGRRVTASLEHAGRRFTGTAGDGVWIEGEGAHRMTPGEQICSNHVVAITEHRGVLYLGAFDEGICRVTDGRYELVTTPFRMVNRMLSTARGLVVAANEGLFVSRDGVEWKRVLSTPDGGWNGLALDGKTLWATTPLTLYRFSVSAAGLRLRSSIERPAGSTALQGVAIARGEVWLASEDRGVIRAHGKKLTVLDRAAGMPSSWIIDVATMDGVVYAATLRDGLVRLEPSIAGAQISRVAGTASWLLHLTSDHSTLFIGAQGGAMKLAAGETQASRISTGALPHDNVYAVAQIRSELYIATEGGLVTIAARQ